MHPPEELRNGENGCRREQLASRLDPYLMRLFNNTSRKCLALASSVSLFLTTFSLAEETSEAPLLPPPSMEQARPESIQEQLQMLQQEYQQLVNEFTMIQQQANESDEVTEAADAHEKLVEEKIAAADPDAMEKINRIRELGDSLTAMQQQGIGQEDAAFQEGVAEYMQIQESLAPLESILSNDEEIQQSQEALNDKVMQVMEQINPNTNRIMDRIDAIQQEAQPLIMQLQQQQMQQMPMPE